MGLALLVKLSNREIITFQLHFIFCLVHITFSCYHLFIFKRELMVYTTLDATIVLLVLKEVRNKTGL